MLTKLTIENYALIDQLEIAIDPGFSVITGETGAGKSILLGALSLILGQRADTSVILEPDRKCIVEGIFRIAGYGLEEMLESADLEAGEQLILRREIWQNGKSRAFINDSPVHIGFMKELGDRLVNIHSQNTITTLNHADFQLAVLDDYAGITRQVAGYRSLYDSLASLRHILDELVGEEERSRGDREYYHFLLDELHAANLVEGEQEELEQRLEILSHAEEIKTGLTGSLQTLSEGEMNILLQLSEILAMILRLSAFHPSLKEIAGRLESDQIDLKDIGMSLGQIEESIGFDQEELDRISSRLDLLYRLEKKHHVTSITELVRIRSELEEKTGKTSSLDDRIVSLKKEIAGKEAEAAKSAGTISAVRSKVIREIEKKIKEMIRLLAIPDGQFRIEQTILKEPGRDGIDSVRFLFSANKGIPLDEISRMASGGELSRLMLSIKSMISRKTLLPTIIFDEIDSGVSGEVAGKVGNILKSMGTAMQVIAITHLPQIAGKGESHFQVYKAIEKGVARSFIRKLNHDERILEIARLVSDEKVTDAAVNAARELLN
jgi:DNA repair protein RecN (Recombination protein N)